MMLIKKRLLLGLVVTLAIGLLACEKVPIEDDPGEQKKAVAVVTRFTEALNQKDADAILLVSGYPFVADGERFDTMESFQVALEKQFKRKNAFNLKLLTARLFSLEEILLIQPQLMKKLSQKGFDVGSDSYVVIASFQEKSRDSERLLFVVRQENGYWKVVGLED